jgi:hypothetical protein
MNQQSEAISRIWDGLHLDVRLTGYPKPAQVMFYGGGNRSSYRVTHVVVLLDDLPAGRSDFNDDGHDGLTTAAWLVMLVSFLTGQAPAKGLEQPRAPSWPLRLAQ